MAWGGGRVYSLDAGVRDAGNGFFFGTRDVVVVVVGEMVVGWLVGRGVEMCLLVRYWREENLRTPSL